MRLSLLIIAGFSTLALPPLAFAQTEVNNPWANTPSPEGVRSEPVMARGRRVALLPRPRRIPAWALNEVLNPWGDQTTDPFDAEEARASDAIRRRARRIARCLPEQHRRYQVRARVTNQTVAGALGQCLTRALQGLQLSGSRMLVLRFDAEGLREAYLLRIGRFAAPTNSPPNAAGDTQPTARGQMVNLLPRADAVPSWAVQEVLNPWGDTPAPALERGLTDAIRGRAAQVAACLPEQHSHTRLFTELNIGRRTLMGGRFGTCLTRALRGITADRGVYTVVLRFDASGLREVYVYKPR